MAKPGPKWFTKLRSDLAPKVEPDPRRGGTMLVPTPLLIAEEVRRVRRGRLITPADLRARLAKRCGADRTCPMTTGILLNVVAGATEERLAAGNREVAPYWRVVAENGVLNPKLPFGPELQAARLRREGHVVRRAEGSTWRVSLP